MLNADLIDEHDWGWSSSEFGNRDAWGVNFGCGFCNSYKYYSNVVRAVSAFNPLKRDCKDEDTPSMTEESAIKFLRSKGYSGVLTKVQSIEIDL